MLILGLISKHTALSIKFFNISSKLFPCAILVEKYLAGAKGQVVFHKNEVIPEISKFNNKKTSK